MNFLSFAKTELSAALARGVRQCVLIGTRATLGESFQSAPDGILQVFVVEEEPLAVALEKSSFDKRQASLFIWLGSAGYRTVEAVFAALAFIASLPKESGVVFDYAEERVSLGSLAHSALDALASRVAMAGDSVKYLIQPQAVSALLRGFGFQKIVDLTQEELPVSGGHLVSAAT